MSKLTRLIRKFSLWLCTKTDYWVVPKAIWDTIDQKQYSKAYSELEKISQVWPQDPQITYAMSTVKFLRGGPPKFPQQNKILLSKTRLKDLTPY